MGRSFYRPWTKVVGPILTNTVTEVDLTDSTGRTLECNFISVECSATTGGILQLHASSIPSGVTISETQAAADVSGFMGTATTQSGGVAQLVMGLGDVTNKIQLLTYSTPATGVLCFINYGNVMQGNTLKDAQRPRGN